MGKRSSKDESSGRIRQKHLLFLFLVCFLLLMLRLFGLQLVSHSYYAGYAEDNQVKRIRMVAPRGLIIDSGGEVLVDNVPRFEIVVPWKGEEKTLNGVRRVINLLPLDSVSVLSRFEQWKRRNAGLAFPVIPDADKVAISIVRENSDVFPSLRVQIKARRRYRFGSLAAHLLGYVGEVSAADTSGANEPGYVPGDMIGKMGLESVCEEYLRGVDGQKAVVENASGVVVGELKEYSFPPLPGRKVYLTINTRLQSTLETLLAQWEVGTAVVMDVETGAIISAASLPQFDPNSFATGIKQVEWDKLYKEEKKPLFNRILQAAYPPGSTLKVITAYAALDNEVVTRSEVITYCTGAHKFGNRIYKCWKAAGHGYMNLLSAIVQSCDAYFFELGASMDVDELAEAARRFGLGAQTGIDLPGEVRGLVPDREYYDRRFGKGRWTQGHVLNNVIGQGEYLASLLQLCRVAAALANGGFLVSPHIIQAIEGEPRRVHLRRRIPDLPAGVLQFLQEAMANVVESPNGTAYWSRAEGISFAGKTGTAQNPHGEDHAWFISFAPVKNPEIAMAVIVENAGHGSSVAAPITRDFYQVYFSDDSTGVLSQGDSKPSDLIAGGVKQR